MPWNVDDYPVSMKNLDPLIRKKAISIANALLADGYNDDRAIPIATSQAEKWFDDATADEKKAFHQEKNPQKNDKHAINKNAQKLMDAAVTVQYQEDHWEVRSKGAERASDQFDHKDDAVTRGKEIAQNKQSVLTIYKQDGTKQQEIDYRDK
ncbi:hypothetical protein A5886_000022 [Enterococcus sp. 8G7_MSG3316]|uniref:DUF2188 domain-containing protein n=1 Tax=Candidatus Enterococcus testudinis TaxID=1834191 RepID=A0A242A1R0_9ENTE|nr:DUF2188 domain-containing protein [Enterococcus sp. 8G7_MSG3316]OTN74978.1 hypothetical protein A5886_000022 [Enterococcus sp. 8G7_MSG3316]